MTTVLRIGGMSCQHCVRHVQEALEEMQGVHRAEVDLAQAVATVEHDEAVTCALMAAAVEEAGYEMLA